MLRKFTRKISNSFTMQLALWVASIVVALSCILIWLLASFSEEVIRRETIDATLQALENTALRINNTIEITRMNARLEGQRVRINRSRIDRLVEESNSQEQLQQSLPNIQFFVTRRDSSQIDIYITGNERGYRQLQYENQHVYIFTQPLNDNRYSLTAVCPAKDINAKFAYLHQQMFIWSICGVLLLLFVLYHIIAHYIRPLHQLADTAQSIADGNLDIPIPDNHSQHEAGRLQSSLKKMQSSLRNYMDEMQQKKTILSSQNAELQAAYDEAQAYEEKKAKFLHDMVKRMGPPVRQVCRSTDAICRAYPQISAADMEALEADVIRETQKITELLDQLIKEPAAS